jgi:uncharacterized protein
MTDVSGLAYLGIGVAAVAGGFVNAVAGGGTLITFPVLTAVGVPSVRANATNTVSLLPGYLGGTYAQRKDLDGLAPMVRPQLVAAALGGLAGSILLIITSESLFRQIVPFLILAACLLLALQDRLRALIFKEGTTHQSRMVMQVGAIGASAVYGGYFGAGLGIMLIAVLGLFSALAINRLNAVKQLLQFAVNLSAASFLSFSGTIEWKVVAVMAPAALIGGNVGGRFAGSLKPKVLRTAVVAFGFVVAIVYLVR